MFMTNGSSVSVPEDQKRESFLEYLTSRENLNSSQKISLNCWPQRAPFVPHRGFAVSSCQRHHPGGPAHRRLPPVIGSQFLLSSSSPATHQHHRHHLFQVSLQQLPSSPVSRLLHSRGCVLPCPALPAAPPLFCTATRQPRPCAPLPPPAPSLFSLCCTTTSLELGASVKPAALAAHDLTASILPSATSNIAQSCRPRNSLIESNRVQCAIRPFFFFFPFSFRASFFRFIRFEKPPKLRGGYAGLGTYHGANPRGRRAMYRVPRSLHRSRR
ncbi:hypothetical protein HDK77DRAFT_4578 [Phyllosticta capitalensis]